MTQYFAVFKTNGAAMASTLSYDAPGVNEAIQKMVSEARCESTAGLSEFEIYEVVGLRKYKPVASRLPSIKKSAPRVMGEEKPKPVVEEEPAVVGEVAYVAYEVTAL